MSPKKTATLNLRIDPAIKEAVKEAAELERRSVANFIEVLITEHCEAVGITIPEQGALFDDEKGDGCLTSITLSGLTTIMMAG